MDKTLEVQKQIRQNAEEISNSLISIKNWEKEINKRDHNIKIAHQKSQRIPRAPIRSGVGTIPIEDLLSTTKATAITNSKETSFSKEQNKSIEQVDIQWQTPSSIVNKLSSNNNNHTISQIVVPKARGEYISRDIEEIERERGNLEFQNGNFTAAIKLYTKCLGLKAKNYIAFSNRAAAYLKLKEYARAIMDCSSALLIESNHIKSLLRRSTGYNAIGKHRCALNDLLLADDIETNFNNKSNRQIKIEIQNTKELLRNCVSRAPMIPLQSLSLHQYNTTTTTNNNNNNATTTTTNNNNNNNNNATTTTTTTNNNNNATTMIESSSDAIGNNANNQSKSEDNNVLFRVIAGPDFKPPNFNSNNNLDNSSINIDQNNFNSNNNLDSSSINIDQNNFNSNNNECNILTQELSNIEIKDSITQHRIVIDDTSDNDDEEDDVLIRTIPITLDTGNDNCSSSNDVADNNVCSSTSTTSFMASNTTTTTAINNYNNNNLEKNKSNDIVEIKIHNSYELEKELLQCNGNISLIGNVLKAITTKSLKIILSDLLEPTILYLLLISIIKYYGYYIKNYKKVYILYNSISKVSVFKLQYTLLSKDMKNEIVTELYKIYELCINNNTNKNNNSTSNNTTSSNNDDENNEEKDVEIIDKIKKLFEIYK